MKKLHPYIIFLYLTIQWLCFQNLGKVKKVGYRKKKLLGKNKRNPSTICFFFSFLSGLGGCLSRSKGGAYRKQTGSPLDGSSEKPAHVGSSSRFSFFLSFPKSIYLRSWFIVASHWLIYLIVLLYLCLLFYCVNSGLSFKFTWTCTIEWLNIHYYIHICFVVLCVFLQVAMVKTS